VTWERLELILSHFIFVASLAIQSIRSQHSLNENPGPITKQFCHNYYVMRAFPDLLKEVWVGAKVMVTQLY
jgi:hypothetical protein